MLKDVKEVHGDTVAMAFLKIHIDHALDALALQTASSRPKAVESLAGALYLQHPSLMLAEWLMFFHWVETHSELIGTFSQAKFMRCFKTWIAIRNDKKNKIYEAEQKAKKEASLKNCITYEQYLANKNKAQAPFAPRS